MIAASFDDIIAITGFSICIQIAFGLRDGSAWQIAVGPLQVCVVRVDVCALCALCAHACWRVRACVRCSVSLLLPKRSTHTHTHAPPPQKTNPTHNTTQVVFGIAGGLAAGFMLGWTRLLFDNKYKRLIGIYGAALFLMFFLESFDMLSGGALGSLAVGLATCYAWEEGFPRRASLGPNSDYSADIERVVAKVWNWVMEPLLFGTIGVSINFAKLSPGIIPTSLIIIISGLTLRVIATFFVMTGFKDTWRERGFYAIAWTPKATVQAALSAVPLSMAMKYETPGTAAYDQWVYWGEAILTTGIFTIVVCASAGTLLTYWLAPVLLKKVCACRARVRVCVRAVRVLCARVVAAEARRQGARASVCVSKRRPHAPQNTPTHPHTPPPKNIKGAAAPRAQAELAQRARDHGERGGRPAGRRRGPRRALFPCA